MELVASFPTGSHGLDFTSERYTPDVKGELRAQHLHRYASVAGLAEGRRILDIACGEGYGTAALAERAQPTLGIDIAPEAVCHAKHRHRPHANVIEGSILENPAPDSAFDLVGCFEAIEHLSNQAIAARELRGVLSKGCGRSRSRWHRQEPGAGLQGGGDLRAEWLTLAQGVRSNS